MANARRIAVIGGGIGGLATAYEIVTRKPDCEITIFQMGWRLGGKCSASRSADRSQRIEEHGIHAFFGCYENAFHLMRRVYGDLGRDWKAAFEPESTFTLYDKYKGHWDRWDFRMPRLPGEPGSRLGSGSAHGLPALLDLAKELIRSVRDQIFDDFGASGLLKGGMEVVLGATLDAIDRLVDPTAQEIDDAIDGLKNLFDRFLDLGPVLTFAKFVMPAGDRLELASTFRKVRVLAELGLAGAIGLLRAAVRGTSLAELDEKDLTEWLHENAIGGGLSDMAVDSAPLRMVYEASFAFENGDPERRNFGAGTAIYVVARVLFDYRGSLSYKMKQGSAETLVTPLYRALRGRNVRFEFFHRADEITLTPDGEHVASVRFTVQSRATSGDYEPLIDGTDCWPDRPKYDLLVNGTELSQSNELGDRAGFDLEDPRSTPDSLGQRTIAWRGAGGTGADAFDDVILAIPPAASERACAALKQSPRVGDRWTRMYARLQTTPTQSCQLWFDRTAEQMGWPPAKEADTALVGCYEQPFGNWADLSVVLAHESWPPEANVVHAAYLCGMLIETDELKPFDPPKWRRTVRDNAEKWVTSHAELLWPNVFPGGQFDWDRLADLEGGNGRARFATQFFRANLSPSGRYVLSVKGTTKDRFRPHESGFANLFLAGDWTRNGANNGCVEATAMSARQAARALLGLGKDELPVHCED